jgi:two-component system, NarL family, nitrate/nitrite response regulator NarL
MMDLIDIAVIEDNRMFIDGLRTWAETEPDIRLAAVTSTVDELLGAAIDDTAWCY